MADFATPVSVPQELNFTNLPATLPESKTYQFRVSPNGVGTGSTSLGSGTTLQIPIPSIQRAFWQGKSSYITGRATFTVSGLTADTDFGYILGSAYSFFSNWALRSVNGSSIDNIQNPAIIATDLITLGIDFGAKTAYANNLLTNQELTAIGSATTCGFKFNYGSSKAGSGLILDFAIPMLGCWTCNNYIPAWNEMLLELTVNSLANCAIDNSGTGSLTACSLSNIEFVSEVIEMTPASFDWLRQTTFPDGIINLKTETFTYSTGNIPASTVGTVDIPIGVRCKSLKRLFINICPSNAFDAPLASVCPNATGISMVINGQSIPQRPLQLNKPADAYAYLMNAMGGLTNPDKAGSINIESYRSASTAYVTSVYEAYATAFNETQSNFHPIVINCESLDADSLVLFNGINTTGSTSNILRVEIGTALSAYTHVVNMFGNFDAIWNFDMNTNTTTLYYA